jgi:hypothetical protein
MAWTYSGDPATSDLDELRFMIQDTREELPLLLDEEINYLIAEWMPRYDSLTYCAAIGAQIISRKFAGVVTVSADGVSVNTSELAARYKEMAAGLREEYKSAQVGGEVDISNIMIGHGPDPGIKPLHFALNLHDNPEAGMQDYGGWQYDPLAVGSTYAAEWYPA